MSFLKVDRWNGEATFEIAQPTSISNVAHNVYDIDAEEGAELGGKEWEVTFAREPAINVFQFQCINKNLRFHYQPPLTEEIAEKDCSVWTSTYCVTKNEGLEYRRPENVVGSYAVYHASKRHNRYKTGKAFHIYRPKLIDAKGEEAWGSLNYNTQTHVLTITLPSAWLASATYPVVVDPTFGYTNIGGSTNTSCEIGFKSLYALGENGTVTTLHAYIANYNAGAEDASTAIYDGTALEVEKTTSCTGATTEWVTFDCADTALTAATYGLAVKPMATAMTVYYDTTTADAYLDLGLTCANPLGDPFGRDAGPVTRDYSVYATYTVAGGLSIPVVMHHYGHHIAKIIRG